MALKWLQSQASDFNLCVLPALIVLLLYHIVSTMRSLTWKAQTFGTVMYINIHFFLCILYIYIYSYIYILYIYIYIWAALKINCWSLVRKYRLSPFFGGPYRFSVFCSNHTKYCKNEACLASDLYTAGNGFRGAPSLRLQPCWENIYSAFLDSFNGSQRL